MENKWGWDSEGWISVPINNPGKIKPERLEEQTNKQTKENTLTVIETGQKVQK